MIVEIDEIQLTKKKTHRDHIFPEVWVFGSICRLTDEIFKEKVPDRTLKTLLSVIYKYVNPSSIIYSDSWQGYSLIKNHYKH